MMPDPKRGQIWRVSFDPKAGAEIGKVRPALVMSTGTVGVLPLRIVVPITDWKSRYATIPWFVYIPPSTHNGLVKDSGADAFQTKSIAISRFKKRLGHVPADIVEEVAAAIALCVGYTP